ncbi:MAG: transcription antitermination factor NusB [Candidatus Pelagibacterales bacterium]|jgi:N utilization substance protein B|tara:strand:- start:132 stop:560 length:429 start_codon:yes stop_codon:yes gene_type:complete
MTEIKSLQRMLAVQVLYQESINPNDDSFDINKTLIDAVETLKLNKLKMKPNLNFAKKIYSGVSTNNKAIDADILLALGSSHDFKKFENLLQFILKAAVFELKYDNQLSKKIIISEYLKITDSFYANNEASLVNGILDNIQIN